VDPASEDECDAIACTEPYVASDESLLKGTIYLTLLQDSTEITLANKIEMERALLNFLADNVGKDSMFQPVCAYTTGHAYYGEDVPDGSGKFAESNTLEMELTFVEKIDLQRRASIHLDAKSVDEDFILMHQGHRNLQSCAGIDLALCCSQDAINNSFGEYCTNLGCERSMCGRGRRRSIFNRRLEEEESFHHVLERMSDTILVRRAAKSGKSSGSKSGKSSKSSKSSGKSSKSGHYLLPGGRPPSPRPPSPSIATNKPTNSPVQVPSGGQTPSPVQVPSGGQPPSGGLPSTKPPPSGNQRSKCSEYGVFKAQHFKAIVSSYTSFTPQKVLSVLDATDTESVAICSANRFSLDSYDTPIIDCNEFSDADCVRNEDIIPEPDPSQDCLAPIVKLVSSSSSSSSPSPPQQQSRPPPRNRIFSKATKVFKRTINPADRMRYQVNNLFDASNGGSEYSDSLMKESIQQTEISKNSDHGMMKSRISLSLFVASTVFSVLATLFS